MMTFVDFDISVIAKIVLRDIDLPFEGKILNVNISETVKASAQICGSLLSILTFAIECRHCEKCSP